MDDDIDDFEDVWTYMFVFVVQIPEDLLRTIEEEETMILHSRDTSFTYSTPMKSSEANGLSLKEIGYVNSSTFISNGVMSSNT